MVEMFKVVISMAGHEGSRYRKFMMAAYKYKINSAGQTTLFATRDAAIAAIEHASNSYGFTPERKAAFLSRCKVVTCSTRAASA